MKVTNSPHCRGNVNLISRRKQYSTLLHRYPCKVRKSTTSTHSTSNSLSPPIESVLVFRSFHYRINNLLKHLYDSINTTNQFEIITPNTTQSRIFTFLIHECLEIPRFQEIKFQNPLITRTKATIRGKSDSINVQEYSAEPTVLKNETRGEISSASRCISRFCLDSNRRPADSIVELISSSSEYNSPWTITAAADIMTELCRNTSEASPYTRVQTCTHVHTCTRISVHALCAARNIQAYPQTDAIAGTVRYRSARDWSHARIPKQSIKYHAWLTGARPELKTPRGGEKIDGHVCNKS